MGVHTRLVNMRNPLFRVKKRFARYLIITCCTGTLSFLVALALLHAGSSPLVSLVVSVLASGILHYGALELWGFPHRKGLFSWKRLGGSSLVGAGAFLGRYGMLLLGLRLFHSLAPLDKLPALALAYLTSFLIGYLLRSRVVFRHSASSRRHCKI